MLMNKNDEQKLKINNNEDNKLIDLWSYNI